MEKAIIVLFLFLVSCTTIPKDEIVIKAPFDNSSTPALPSNDLTIEIITVNQTDNRSLILPSDSLNLQDNISQSEDTILPPTVSTEPKVTPAKTDILPPPELPSAQEDIPKYGETVLLTAPHNVAHIREGAIKPADICTGFIAEALHNLTGVPIMILREESRDPNFYDDVQFKIDLGQYISDHPRLLLVIDIHGADRSRPFDVDIGDMYGKSLIHDATISTQIEKIMIQHGIINISHNFFSASHQQTVTKFVANHGVDAVQLEINREYRCEDEEKTEQLLSAMEEIVKKYS